MTPCAKKRYKYVTQCAYVVVIANNYTLLFSNIFSHDNSDKHIDVAHILIKTAVCFLFFINIFCYNSTVKRIKECDTFTVRHG